jgi:MFS family permease
LLLPPYFRSAAAPAALIQFRVPGAAAGHPALAQAIFPTSILQQQGRAIAGSDHRGGPIKGPVLCGIITDIASWRWIFLLNLPWAIARRVSSGPATVSQAANAIDGREFFAGYRAGTLQLSLERSIARHGLLAGDNC